MTVWARYTVPSYGSLDWQALKRRNVLTCIGTEANSREKRKKSILLADMKSLMKKFFEYLSALEDNFFSRQLHSLQWCLYCMHCVPLYAVKNKPRKCYFFCYIGKECLNWELSSRNGSRLAQRLSRKTNRELKNERAPLAVILDKTLKIKTENCDASKDKKKQMSGLDVKLVTRVGHFKIPRKLSTWLSRRKWNDSISKFLLDSFYFW